MTSQQLRPLLLAIMACLSAALLAGMVVAIASSSSLVMVAGAAVMLTSLIGLFCSWRALRLPAPKPVEIEVPVTQAISIASYLDGLEQLIAGDSNSLVGAPATLNKSERDRLNRATARFRQIISDNQNLQTALQQLQDNKPIPLPSQSADELPNPATLDSNQALLQHAMQLEKMASKLLAAADANEEHRDDAQEQLAALKLQARKLSDRSRTLADTIELLKDLAEQSGVLALNTAIQASRSGEAGLAVVADELQRVANRHSDASRQLEESLLQLNNELVETNDMIDHGRQLLGKGQHDLSQLRSHIGKLSRSCQQLKEATLSANGQATDQQVAL